MWLYRRIRAHLRGGTASRMGDEASGTMVSYIVGAAVFLVGATFLFDFSLDPPKTAGLEAATAATKAGAALDVLLGSAGYPSAWNASDASSKRLERLGLLESGSTVRVDPAKFYALARGSLYNPDKDDIYVDYAEARRALGLTDVDFHLRAFPATQLATETNFGVVGIDGFTVGYVGDYTGTTTPSSAARLEQGVLDDLNITFTNSTRLTSGGTGSVFPDDATTLRNALVPVIGVGVTQAVISEGAGATKQDFARVNKTQLTGILGPQANLSLTTSLALWDGNSPTYAKNRELRAIIGTANFSGLATATMQWNEYVDTNLGQGLLGTLDGGDFGFIELSPDGGQTWYQMTNTAAERSQDSPTAPFSTPATEGLFKARTLAISSANCGACLGKNEVLVALHWVADGDNDRGYGWVVDDVRITTAGGFHKNFEAPEFDLLIIGTGVDQNALTSAEIKNAIADYVEVYGGRLVVLGGEPNVNWLQPLFHVGIRTSAAGVGRPDTTHPLLTVPNELAYSTYSNNDKVWDFTSSSDDDLFQMVVSDESSGHILSISTSGAFGGPEDGGAIMLSTYMPGSMSKTEASKFLANTIMYGKFNHLYLDYGPEVPSNGVQVVAATRTATMDYTKDLSGSYIDMSFIMYQWPGNFTSSGSASAVRHPLAPTITSVHAANATVHLNWSEPADSGFPISTYNVYRGTAPGVMSYLTSLNGTRYLADTGLTNGVTYYYNVTASNYYGQGYASRAVNATPATQPGPVESPSVLGGGGILTITWNEPSPSGGAATTGYWLWGGRDTATPVFTVPVGVNRSWTHITGSSETWYFRVSANNSLGQGNWSSFTMGDTLATPGQPTALVAFGAVDRIELNWATAYGTTTGYRILRGTSSGSLTQIAEISTNTSYADHNVDPATTYYYAVRAFNTNGESTSSNEVVASLGSPPLAPSLTAGPAWTAAGRVLLTITEPADIGGAPAVLYYHIYRAPALQTPVFVLNVTANGTTTQWDDAGLTPGGQYDYQVAAVTMFGAGSLSSPAVRATASVVANPVVLTATSLAGHIGLSWTNTTDILSYNIYRNDTALHTTHALLATIGTNVSYVDFTPHKGVLYSYVVKAVNPLGEGGPSNVASATSIGSPTSAVVVGATGVGAGKVTLTVTAPESTGGAALTNYTVFRKLQDVGDFAYVDNVTYTGSPQVIADTAPSAGQTYEYMVRAWNTAGYYSDSVPVPVVSGVGLP